jgi:hypothetical protein
MNPLTIIPKRYHSAIREKAIKRAETRIILAGKTPQDFTSEDLEIVVQEEEDKLKSAIKEKGLLAILALLGLSWFG